MSIFDLDDFNERYGDPRPLAIIDTDPAHHRKAANAWAREHPNAKGYIVIPKDIFRNGYYFYDVAGGKAVATSAIDCQPNRFAWQDRHCRGR